MKSSARRRISTAVLLFLVALGAQSVTLAQGPGGPGHDGERVRGRITAITGNSIDVERRNGDTATIVTTGSTTFVRNGQPAALTDFVPGDHVMARGQQNGNGVLVADAVRGGDGPPHPHQGNRVGGEVASIDTTAGTMTVTTPGGETVTIYTTPETRIFRNRQPATLADFQTGDRVRARGERDPDNQFIAERILGGASQ